MYRGMAEQNMELADARTARAAEDSAPPPVLLFFNDFPPSNSNGGTVLIRRLLDGYPAARLIGLTSQQSQVALQKSRKASLQASANWCAIHSVFPSIFETGRWGISRLKGILN